ncbi:MAG TPA: hypothetical protein ENK88_06405 [Campylobacterales bacterium]|nr:hypothetical protein [Campylobacterales bacterium]HHD81296.1 hypothetical protein [Campylobacterales bacterium]
MKIVFDKIGQTPKPFDLTVDSVNFKGTLVKSAYHRVRLEGSLDGVIDLTCDRCGDEYQENISSPLSLTLSDEIIETEDDLDIIEFLDGVIDLDFIVQSEIASIQNSYHNCKNCENDTQEFEKEF